MLLKTLLPMGTAVAELDRFPNATTLLPAEAELTTRFAEKRLLEFAAGRWCARTALREFSVVDVPILVGKNRQPLWPVGFTGSITHTDNYCAAAIAPLLPQVASIGIDAEIVGRVGVELWPMLFRSEEMRWLNALPLGQQAAVAALLFSGKEAFFKCQFPLTDVWLDFRDVDLVIENETSFLVKVVNGASSQYTYSGRYGLLEDRQLMITTMVASQ